MSEKSDLLSNQKEIFSRERKAKNGIQNDPQRSKLESKQNYVGQVAHLFSGLKLSEGELKKLNEEKMEMSQMATNSTESGSKNNQFSRAGKTISLLSNLSTVLVQPVMIHNSLLNIGTNLFIQKLNSDCYTKNCPDYLSFGKIEEVFGNVEAPLYAVRLSPENYFPKVEDEVFYLSSDPSTSLFHIECGNSGKSEVIYHR